MDPVTTAILAALAAGAASGLTESGKKVIVDSYESLKDKLKKRFGADSKVVDAVQQLEQEPESKGRKLLLQENVEAAEADKDPEVSAAAKDLLSSIGGLPEGSRYINIATAIGKRSIAANTIIGNPSTGDQIKE